MRGSGVGGGAGFEYVLTVEGMGLSFPLMVGALGLGGVAVGRRNVSAVGDGVDMADLRRALVDVNGAEFACYERVRAREMGWVVERVEATPRA